MHGWLGAVSEDELSAGMARFTARQQKLRTIVGASNPAVMPMFLDQYAALLDVLEARPVAQQLFLFGERPSIADFGLYGMLSQFVIDPTPSRILRERAVRLFQWTQYVDDLSGHDGAWSTDREPSETVRALVKLAGRSLLPMMVAVSDAVARGQQPCQLRGRGRAHHRLRPSRRGALLAVAEADVRRIAVRRPPDPEAVARGGGFWKALAFAPGEAERVPVLSP